MMFDEVLEARGLFNAVDFFGVIPAKIKWLQNKEWEPVVDWVDPTGWAYPCVYPPGYRGLQLETYRYRPFPDGGGGYVGLKIKILSQAKSQLPAGKLPPFYVSDWERLQNSVAYNNNVCYGVEGEPDTMTLGEMGIFNAIGIIGVGNVKPSIVVELEKLGVSKFVFIVDTDSAGFQLGDELTTLFQGSTVELQLKKLPYYVRGESIKDVNDYWQAVNFKSTKSDFLAVLDDYIPLQDIKTHYGAEEFYSDEFYDEIARRLGVTGYNSKGFSNHVANPCEYHEEDDRNPASGWHKDKKILCDFKSASRTWYLAKEVAEALDIDPSQYRKQNDYMFQQSPPSPNKPKPKKEQTAEQRDTLLRVGISENIQALYDVDSNPYMHKPVNEYLVPLKQAMRLQRQVVGGERLDDKPPIKSPFLHPQLRGVFPAFKRRSLFMVIGISGGYKTSFLFTATLGFLREGYNVLMWTPEWDSRENASRAAQMLTGVSVMSSMLAEMYHHEQKLVDQGVLQPDEVVGAAMSDSQLNSFDRALDEIESYPGELFFTNEFGADAIQVTQMLDAAHEQLKRSNMEPTVWVVDYAQLAHAPAHIRNNFGTNDFVRLLKAQMMRRDAFAMVSSQSTKMAQKAVKDGADLGKDDGVNLRDDEANYSVTLTPKQEKQPDPDSGILHTLVKCAISKSSIRDPRYLDVASIPLWLSHKTTLFSSHDWEPALEDDV